jgi:hypothetical protein
MSATEAISKALERLNATARAYGEAQEAYLNASAEWARLSLIASAESDGEVCGARFSTEYCYDDEGGYFDAVSVALVDTDGEDIDYDSELESCGPEAIRRLCGCADGADSGAITLAEARERSF